jgi:hypothetical protein
MSMNQFLTWSGPRRFRLWRFFVNTVVIAAGVLGLHLRQAGAAVTDQ